jgi:SAM-dependent methyltransferase
VADEPVNAPKEWFDGFFEGLALEFWRVAVPDAVTREEAAFLWKHLALSPGDRVLDVGCGHGRLAIPIAMRGAAVTGADLSAEFLRAAARAARDAPAGVSIEWRKADMRRLPEAWRGRFDAAYCMGNSFGYCDDAGNEATLAAVARSLKPGGRFVLDFGQVAESIFARGIEPRAEADVGGFHFVEETRYDIATARIENRFVISKGGRTEEKLAAQRVYLANDIRRLLEGAGFRVLASFGSSGEEPYALGAQRLLTVAQKRRVRSAGRARRRGSARRG